MKTITLIFGAAYGMISILLGAFGAHALKKILPDLKLLSFETGVRYQMYSAFFLLFVGYILKFESKMENFIVFCMILGVLLFSGSIYLLSLQDYWGINLRFLGPITPIGGLLMIISWGLLFWYFLKCSWQEL